MDDKFKALKIAMGIGQPESKPAPENTWPKWSEVLGEFLQIGTSQYNTDEDKEMVLDILRFEGYMQLDPTSEFPHSKSPENMLKFLATQFVDKKMCFHPRLLK